MPALDRCAPRRFLLAAFEPDDAVAIFLKSYENRAVAQRVVSLRHATSDRFLAWLRARNAERWNIYVSVNAVDADRRSRARDAVVDVRHVFLETDNGADRFLAAIAERHDLPQPTFLMRTSSGRAHLLWRVRGFSSDRVETLQKTLARDLAGDMAATSCSQTTRVPGFFNHKRAKPYLVTLQFGRLGAAYRPSDFPAPSYQGTPAPTALESMWHGGDRAERVRAYLAATPPAVAGSGGDRHTFRVCCRIVRGFDLDDDAAVSALRIWNERCVPPWSVKDLAEKVLAARRYGSEPFGGRLGVLTAGSCVSSYIQVR
jgi:RepB DNA-primase from phage plasmid